YSSRATSTVRSTEPPSTRITSSTSTGIRPNTYGKLRSSFRAGTTRLTVGHRTPAPPTRYTGPDNAREQNANDFGAAACRPIGCHARPYGVTVSYRTGSAAAAGGSAA